MQMEEPVEETQIQDMTEKDLINLRRTIYLVIMSSIDFEECTHKLLKLNIRFGLLPVNYFWGRYLLGNVSV